MRMKPGQSRQATETLLGVFEMKRYEIMIRIYVYWTQRE